MTQQTQVYDTIKLIPTDGNPRDGVHCVPESWIRIRDPDSPLVIVRLPDEPWKVTQERVQKYESPREDWNMHIANIIYSTNSYQSVIRFPKDKCEKEGTCEDSDRPDNSILQNLMVGNEIGKSSSFQFEFYQWLSRQSDSDDLSLSIETSSQSEGFQNLEEEDLEDVPSDLSIYRKLDQISENQGT